MIRKRRARRIGILFAAIGGGALVCGLIFVIVLRLRGVSPSSAAGGAQATPRQGLVNTTTPEAKWLVTFSTDLTAGGWSLGYHGYLIEFSCPGVAPSYWNGTLQISDTVVKVPQRVYLRTSGVRDAVIEGNEVGAVHPEQLVGAALTLEYDSLDQAEQARNNCRAAVRLDNGSPVIMDPRIPYQH